VKDAVDFLVIGAQKSATTSLFRYLSAHPSIYMPPEKELDFFSDDERVARGLPFYLREYFSRGDPGRRWGEASPSYMASPRTPERIARLLPDARLVAILRNPVTRALSHWRMARGRSLEDRAFAESVAALAAHGPAHERDPDPERDYLALGEYGRILSRYLDHFDPSRLLVLFAEDLAWDVAGQLRRAYRFLDVAADFRSPVFERRFHVTGEKRWGALRGLLDSAAAKRLAHGVVPERWLRRWNHWILTEFATDATPPEPIDRETRERLRRHFRADVERLETLLGRPAPWPDFEGTSR